tara:strand:+ start:781 stop:1863 length:1083 start_codon:yes stop_codon:yes gene_type:complete
MKRFYLQLLFLISTQFLFSQVGINTITPSAAAVLDVSSSSDGVNFGGFMPPRVSVTERNGISATAIDDGLMVYVTDGTDRCLQIWNGVDISWQNVYCMPINQAPVANLVKITGTFQVGNIVTSNFFYTDAEGDSAGTHTYVWYRADDNIGTNAVQIQSGTSTTFTITSNELNKYISVEVTPLATSGTSPGTTIQSIYYGPIINPSTTALDLFISEYVEGSSNNKVFEIANFTGSSINISNYKINIYFNGSSSATGVSLPSVTLTDGDVYVISHTSTASPCNNNIDLMTGSLSFNGNDVIELVTISNVRIDIIGIIGVNDVFAENITLRKKTGVGPNTNYNTGDYDSYSIDTCDNIGNHTY